MLLHGWGEAQQVQQVWDAELSSQPQGTGSMSSFARSSVYFV